MQTTFIRSDSFVGSLCREIDFIRKRSKQLSESIGNYQSKTLISRLTLELEGLEKRREQLLRSAIELKKSNFHDNLSIEFFIELINRG